MKKQPRSIVALMLAFVLVFGTIFNTVVPAQAKIVTTTMIEDFESYTDGKVSSTWKMDGYGDTVKVSTEAAESGSTALVYNYKIGEKGYTGAYRSVSKLDLSKYKGISLWVKQDGSANKMVLQLKESNGDVWESTIDPLSTGSGEVKFSFDSFKGASWGEGNKDSKAGQSPITQIGIFVNKNDSGASEGTIYVDDIQGYDGPEVEIKDPIDDSVSLVDDGVDTVIDDFSSSADGWKGYSGEGYNGTPEVSYNSDAQAMDASVKYNETASETAVFRKQLDESLSLADNTLSVKQVTTDKLVNGTNEFIIDGGKAA